MFRPALKMIFEPLLNMNVLLYIENMRTHQITNQILLTRLMNS